MHRRQSRRPGAGAATGSKKPCGLLFQRWNNTHRIQWFGSTFVYFNVEIKVRFIFWSGDHTVAPSRTRSWRRWRWSRSFDRLFCVIVFILKDIVLIIMNIFIVIIVRVIVTVTITVIVTITIVVIMCTLSLFVCVLIVVIWLRRSRSSPLGESLENTPPHIL